jgi:thioredoxin 1
MLPTVEAAAEDFKGQMSFVSMDIDEMENLAEPLGLVGVPTYLIFKDGREVGRIIGYNQKKTFYDEVDKILGNKEK